MRYGSMCVDNADNNCEMSDGAASNAAAREADDARLAAAMAASLQTQDGRLAVALEASKKHSLNAVLSALQNVGPILSQFIDEHCALIAPGISTDESAMDLWRSYNAAVDAIVLTLLADHGLDVNVAAAALVQAREASSDARNHQRPVQAAQ